MAIDVVGELVRVTIAAQYPDAQIEMCNIGYKCTAAGAADTRAGLGLAVMNLFVANYITVMSPNSFIYGWRVQQLAPLPPAASASAAVTTVGTGTGVPAPTQARPLLRLRTAFAGRKFRGRLYLFTPIQNCTDATAYPTAGVNAAVTALGVAIASAITVTGSTWAPQILHKPTTPGGPWTGDAITSNQNPKMLATQRRSGNTGRLNSTPW